MILDCLAVRIYLFRKYHSFYLEDVTQEESIIDDDHVVYTLLLLEFLTANGKNLFDARTKVSNRD